jgi:SAM-dependent methyltransferase
VSGVSRRALFSLGAARLIRDDAERVSPAAQAAAQARAAWDAPGSPELARRLEPAARALVAFAGVRPGMRVLDVGAGDGSVALAAAGAEVTALDFSPARVAEGRARCPQAEWVVAGVEAMPFADAEFDAVLSSFGAIFSPRPRAAVAEMARVGRPGAPIALTAFTPAGFMGRLLDLAARWSPLPVGVPRPARWGRYESAFLWLGSAVEGFDMEDRALPLRFASADAAWRCFVSAPGPFATALRGPAAPEPAQARAAFDDLIAGAAAEGGGLSIGIGYVAMRGHIANAGRAARRIPRSEVAAGRDVQSSPAGSVIGLRPVRRDT